MRKGFAPILILIAILLSVVSGLIAYRHFASNKNGFQNSLESSGKKGFFQNLKDNANNSSDLNSLLGGSQCQGTGTRQFGSPPMNLFDIGAIVPMGLMIDAHVTPIDHIYFNPKDVHGPRDEYPVLAIADGTIIDIEHRTNFVGDKNNSPNGKTDEYRVVVEYTCSFFSYYDLITSLAPSILSRAGNIDARQNDMSPIQIPIKEGQEIGRIGGQTLDFAVWNNDVILKGFIVPAHYQGEPWKIHTDDPFKYFKEPLKDQLLALDLRTVEPREGKIDYDVDGKLVGTWFKKGTGGYDYARTNRQSGWTNQLSIVYDYLDPTQVRISIGDYNGHPSQFGVKGNTPDPKDVDKSSGLIKYELVQYDYYDQNGGPWDRLTPIKNIQSRNQTQVQAIVLIQMLEDRRIKFEVFPGKTGAQISGFDNSALTYER